MKHVEYSKAFGQRPASTLEQLDVSSRQPDVLWCQVHHCGRPRAAVKVRMKLGLWERVTQPSHRRGPPATSHMCHQNRRQQRSCCNTRRHGCASGKIQ
eukprot:scaffold3978_cov112-Isochrysis_galbana.AAC.4